MHDHKRRPLGSEGRAIKRVSAPPRRASPPRHGDHTAGSFACWRGLTIAMMLVLTGGFARAASTNDETFANASLRELHNLAVASAQAERAAKDGDSLGCRDAYDSMQKAAHEALTNMHYMSFAPINALDGVSSLLRVSNLAPNGCPDKALTRLENLPLMAGQAILALRYDYSIGDGDWYMIDAGGDVEAKNPVRYAQSLKSQNYSWVNVRPKGANVMVVPDWKAEMASHEVGDPSIENSGNNLKAVEVDYRKNSGDDNTYVYFYRTKEDAQAAAQASKQQAENDAKAAAELKSSDAEWRQKLTSLPYMIANHDAGFKLTYAACKPAGKNAKGEDTCNADGSHDWSDSRAVPYRWFSDITGCEDAAFRIKTEHPADVDRDAVLISYCVPAPKVSGRTLKGYKMVFALTAPGADGDDNTYADLRESRNRTTSVFQTFNACFDAMDGAYSKTMKDLGADEDGTLVSDKTKSIDLTATCARVY
jgi:hypothetical protein